MTEPTRRSWLPVAVAAVSVLATFSAAIAPEFAARSVGSELCTSLGEGDAPTTTPIHHLFILIKENHAFENYFGALPGVIGYPPSGDLPLSFGGTPSVRSYALVGDSTVDLPHDRPASLAESDGGRQDGFIAEAIAEGYPDPTATMGYYTSSQLPDYYQYAVHYGLADDYFSGVLGPTLPNRLFDLGLTNSTWTSNAPPPPASVAGPTVLGQLSAAGLRWQYDYSGSSQNLAPDYVSSLTGDPCFSDRIQPIASIARQLTGGAAPAVAILDPSNDLVFSEHPPANVSLGSEWTAAVVNAIFDSPVGSSSAILITYDEGGGYWDPVSPPALGPIGDGFRVPFLVLSPWSVPGVVVATPMDFSSVIRFIDTNWGLPYLNERVANAATLAPFFDFSAPARPPLLLSTPVTLTSTGSGGVPGGADS